MAHERVARRYAVALFSAAEEKRHLKDVQHDVHTLASLLERSKELRALLKSPVIKSDKKKILFEKIFEKSLNPITRNFLSLLAEKQREGILPAIINAFMKISDEKAGIAPVSVSSAFNLSDSQIIAIERQFKDLTGKTVRVTVKVDPGMIGGIVARLGDTVFDASVSNKLATLGKRMAENVTA